MLSVAALSRRAIVRSSRVRLPTGTKLTEAMDTINRCFSSPAKKFIMINTVGLERPGIVAEVTRIVNEKGGNVGESNARLLGNHFSLMMLVEVPEPEMENLRYALQNDVKDMTTSCFNTVDPKAIKIRPTIGFTGTFKLSGADNPGIVHKLTSILARNSLTISSMITSQKEAPFGGTQLFAMEGEAVAYEPLASNFDYKKVQKELQELGESLNCDVEFKNITERELYDLLL